MRTHYFFFPTLLLGKPAGWPWSSRYTYYHIPSHDIDPYLSSLMVPSLPNLHFGGRQAVAHGPLHLERPGINTLFFYSSQYTIMASWYQLLVSDEFLFITYTKLACIGSDKIVIRQKIDIVFPLVGTKIIFTIFTGTYVQDLLFSIMDSSTVIRFLQNKIQHKNYGTWHLCRAVTN